MSSPDAMQHGACTALVDPEITLQRSEIGQIHKRWDNLLCKGPFCHGSAHACHPRVCMYMHGYATRSQDAARTVSLCQHDLMSNERARLSASVLPWPRGGTA